AGPGTADVSEASPTKQRGEPLNTRQGSSSSRLETDCYTCRMPDRDDKGVLPLHRMQIFRIMSQILWAHAAITFIDAGFRHDSYASGNR
ncbi:hypothetical protein E0I00_28220, partial [Pseudomonas syringae pv. actinidiae]|nr:hypothetical protein [Pseudomonas syringae pv. actinidiae]